MIGVIISTIILLLMIFTSRLLSKDVLQSCTALMHYAQKAEHFAYLRQSWSNPTERKRILRIMQHIAPFHEQKSAEDYVLKFDNLASDKVQKLVSVIYRYPLKIVALEIVKSPQGKYTMKVKIAS